MAIYVYQITDGSLYSWCPSDDDPVADDATLEANGFDKVIGLPPLDASHAWDASTLTVLEVDPPPTPKPIATSTWIMRFTPDEFAAINVSTDPQVVQFMYSLNHTTTIDLNDPNIVSAVDYFVTAGLLDAARVPEIMA